MTLTGRRALVTGASQGFGLAVARAFANQGAHVFICARDSELLALAAREVSRDSTGEGRVYARAADIASTVQVDQLIDWAVGLAGGLDILVCNAGVYGPKGPIDVVDWNAWRDAISINLLGTVYSCKAVLPLFKSQRFGRIILLSGGGATKPLPYLSAYAASKAAVVRFGETLAEEVYEYGITVNSVAPGALNTRLLAEVIEAGPEKVGQAFYDQSLKQQRDGGTPVERGASLCVFLASDAAKNITGKLISAVWDPWESLPDHADALRASDIYTLRRIVPGDRGVDWK
jgi:NAD(P)-dependent dehydrogenase (short-subunit alcohol dehydrogenase family)